MAIITLRRGGVLRHQLSQPLLGLGIALWILAGLSGQTRAGEVTTLAAFNYANGGAPTGGVTLDAQGNLYGTTTQGGANGVGTVWEVAQGSNTITTLASFNGANESNPLGGVALDAQGNLYGTTQGTNGLGTVWEVANGSNAVTILATFNGSNGSYVYGTVAVGADGNIYGTAAQGGANKLGTVWEVVKGSNTITTIAPFNGPNGNGSLGGVMLDAQGNLYGTTQGGGAFGLGTVWEVAKGSNTITTVASFSGLNGIGGSLLGTVVRDADGNLYGAAQFAGPLGYGTVWEIAKGSNTITALGSFDQKTSGQTPSGQLALDSDGNLYGTTQDGGLFGSVGTVWEVAKGSHTITTIAIFNGPDGEQPTSGVALDASGNLYGTTRSGLGNALNGTVFELSPPFTAVVPEPPSIFLGIIGLALVGATIVLRGRHRFPVGSCSDGS
jgi:uncharacterized repeat protein (TIGR03803 family)